MNKDHAASALADVSRTEQRLAERARWPFYRHAMFGLAEGLIVAGLAQPIRMTGAMTAVALALIVVCLMDDRRQRGMFVSGWRMGATLPFTILLSLFLIVMAVLSVGLRDGVSTQPLGLLAGAFTFVVATWASFRWERIYQSELGRGGQR